MAEVTFRSSSLDWRLPFYLSAILAPLALKLLGGDGELLFSLLLAPLLVIGCVFLLIFLAVGKNRPRCRWLLGGVAAFVSAVVALTAYQRSDPEAIRSTARWLLRSQGYKAQVLAQPSPHNGTLKHIEWDGWGWAGMDTWMYLVFDPTDSLSSAAKLGLRGKVPGIPCSVIRVHRLESHWYTVLYDIDVRWDDC